MRREMALGLLPGLALALGGAPPAPWFGPTAVWTPPWFAPLEAEQQLPDPAVRGGRWEPPPWMMAQGIRSAVFNRLMPEGQLYAGGPAHQLSDGRIFTPAWKKTPQGYVPEWRRATAHAPPPQGCGEPGRHYYSGADRPDGPLGCEKKYARDAVRAGLPAHPPVAGECYQYGGTQYCLPARALSQPVPAEYAPPTDHLSREGSLRDEAMGLIPRGPFAWHPLGLTTHELIDGSMAQQKRAGFAMPKMPPPPKQVSPDSSSSQTAKDTAVQPVVDRPEPSPKGPLSWFNPDMSGPLLSIANMWRSLTPKMKAVAKAVAESAALKTKPQAKGKGAKKGTKK